MNAECLNPCAGWLALHPSGRLILSPRSLLELAPYLRETYRDEDDDDLEPRERTIVDCNRCLKIVTSVSLASFLHLLYLSHDTDDGPL